MTKSWVKECGVELDCTGSMMCPLHEHQTALVMEEIRQTCDLLDDALGERNGYRRDALKYQHLFRLTAFSAAVLVLLVIVMGWR
jgi:hypothetical protein